MSYIQVETLIPGTPEEIFEILSQVENYPKLLPTELEFELTSPPSKMRKGVEYEFKVVRFGFQQLLSLRVEELKPGAEIELSQSLGFFHHYKHAIKLARHDEHRTLLSHFVDYDMQFGILGKLYDDLYLKRFLTQALEGLPRKLQRLLKGSEPAPRHA